LRFNQKSFEENDALGKELLMAFLRSKSHNISVNRDKYAVDLVSTLNEKDYLWEVEIKIKRPWTTKKDFPFPSVSFLSRKEKWKDTDFWYVIICKETNAAIFCHSTVIFQEQYKEKLYINSGERKGYDYFFRVPKNLCIFVPPNEFLK
jgi:hypothetical protein